MSAPQPPVRASASQTERLNSELLCWEDIIDAYIHTSPYERDPNQLPAHRASVNNLIAALSAVRFNISSALYHSHLQRLKTLRRLVDRLHNNLPELLGDLVPPPGREWVMGPNGRKILQVDPLELENLWRMGFADLDMAEMLGVSRETVKRRRREEGLAKRSWDRLTDEELKEHCLRALHEGSGSQGYRMVWAALRTSGISVTRPRVEEAMRGIFGPRAMRSREPRVRRVYDVGWANELWHMDGHHKLITWKFVIHAAIDGFSRAIVFIHCSDNNLADTVTDGFMKATHNWGWPDRVRVDYGKENLGVKAAMESREVWHNRCFIQGPSTANQRIERLWVDLQGSCTDRFKLLFVGFKEEGILDRDHPLDIWTLHFCYKNMINLYIKRFALTWNGHGMSRIDPGHELAMRHLEQIESHRRLQFREYGMDSFSRRATDQPKDTDPYKPCDPPIEDCNDDVALLLQRRDFQVKLRGAIGDFYPIPEDYGRSRYIRARRLVQRYLAGTWGRE